MKILNDESKITAKDARNVEYIYFMTAKVTLNS